MSLPLETQNWKQLAVVQAGGSICLPVLMVGYSLAKLYGVSTSFIAIGLGNLILFAMACVTSQRAAKERKSTAQFAADLFGPVGKIFFTSSLVISLIGWFSIQLQLMGVCLGNVWGDTRLFTIGLGTLIVFAGMRGLQSVTVLAKIVTPLLVVTILYALSKAEGVNSTTGESSRFSLSGLSLVIACSIAAVIDLPTFFRSAQSVKDAQKAAFVLFIAVMPLIEGAGAFLYTDNGKNFVEFFQDLSGNPMWKGVVTAFLVLAGWSTNNANMYSASVSLEQLLPGVSQKMRILIVCFLGTAIACLPILEHIEMFLNCIGIVLSSMGAVLVSCLAPKIKITNVQTNLISWGIGAGFGALSALGWITFTGSVVLDAFVFALFSQLAVGIIYNQRKVHYETS